MSLRGIFLNNRSVLRAGVAICVVPRVVRARRQCARPGTDADSFSRPRFCLVQLLLNYLVDFGFVAAIAWLMSWIGKEKFSSYGLPVTREAGALFGKGLVWGVVPSALILIPIYLAGGCEFHGLALHGKELLFSAVAWGAAMLAMGFVEEFLFRGYALKTLGESVGFWPAAIFLSSIFGLVHLLFKPHEDWIDPISVCVVRRFLVSYAAAHGESLVCGGLSCRIGLRRHDPFCGTEFRQ